MKGVILVAGRGTRMYPFADTKPKALLKVLNKPIIQWSIEALYANGIKDIVFVISPDDFGRQLKEFIQKLELPDLKSYFVEQTEALGTGHALQITEGNFEAGEQMLILYGDDVYGPDNIKQLLDIENLGIIGTEVENPERYGIFKTDETGNLIELVEKPAEYIGNLANIGVIKLDTRIFETFTRTQKSTRGEYELTDGITLLAKDTPIKVVKSTDYWVPIGYPWQLIEANTTLAQKVSEDIQGIVETNVHINGTVVLPKSSVIKAGTYIEGTLIVGENTAVGPNAYIRGVVTVGNNSQIGYGVEVKDSIIGDNSKASHLAYIGCSVLGDNIRFGSHSSTAVRRHDRANIKTPVRGKMIDTGHAKLGSFIGDNAMIGVGTLIYPGRKIAANEMTLPGQTVSKDLFTPDYPNRYKPYSILNIEGGTLLLEVFEKYQEAKYEKLFLVDLDDTLLNANLVKYTVNNFFNKNLSEIGADFWRKSYDQTRKEHLYDVDAHQTLLRNEFASGGKTISKQELWKHYETAITTPETDFKYGNLLDFLNSLDENSAFLILSKGQIEFQKLKIAHLFTYLKKLPLGLLHLENLSKNVFWEQLSKNKSLLEIFHGKLTFIDDRIDELVGLYDALNQDREISLVKVYDDKFNIKDLDLLRSGQLQDTQVQIQEINLNQKIQIQH
jgi:UDP-N-acetylglucosamine diphosphorylase/glucosamine-1-phosphate N-acetyltransferase